jgi:[ribosomal protein S18]-alanine N-acetyltransferase
VNRRLQPLSNALAGPLSMLHCACFPEDPWNSSAIVEIMNLTGFFGRIAWLDDMPAGFILALDLRKECEILSLGVLPERRREGIGSTLLDAVCSEGRVRGAECIFLEVAVDNSAALALYTGRGFTPVGHRPNYYQQASRRVDARVLHLALANIMI